MSQSKASSQTSPTLSDYLADRIRKHGPLPFHEWMREALYHETEGYYLRRGAPIWGREGDYRTSPETSELFAATFARYVSELFKELGSPASFDFIECGAGDGTFAEGFLTSLQSHFPDAYDAIHYLIDDVNEERLRAIRRRLQKFAAKIEFGKLETFPELDPGIVFSNELLDAFPVHRLTKINGQLKELYVDVDQTDSFNWIVGPLSSERLSEIYFQNGVNIVDDQIIELSPEIDDWLRLVSKKLRRGYLITVDYGVEASELYANPERLGGTLRAFSRHSFAEVLEDPGEHDITAHLNWTRIRKVGASLGLETISFQRQDKFLSDAGIFQELARLSTPERSEHGVLRLALGAREMALPNGMASSFQVLVQKQTMNDTFEFIDVSHTVEAGMITYKGLPAPVITDHLSREESRKYYAEGTEFNIARIEMVANTGTYLDSPFHRYEDGQDLSQLELRSLANLDAVVVKCEPEERVIDKRLFENLDLEGKAVLIQTGWDAHWRTEEYWSGRHPFLTRDAAVHLAEQRVALVGIDSYNIDDTENGSRPVHSVLLAQNIPIVEHLCSLADLPASGFKFFAVPVKVRQFGTFPVRAFGLIPKR